MNKPPRPDPTLYCDQWPSVLSTSAQMAPHDRTEYIEEFLYAALRMGFASICEACGATQPYASRTLEAHCSLLFCFYRCWRCHHIEYTRVRNPHYRRVPYTLPTETRELW